jgi:DNA-directed RNA polymerase specialized sigma24 family protein
MFGKEHGHEDDDAYTAEEITQEKFIKLLLCRDILHQVENVNGYIFTIARNKTP